MREVWAHRQLAARQRWVEVGTPAARYGAGAARRGAGRTPRMDRCRHWASTRRRSCTSSATTTRRSRACTPNTRSRASTWIPTRAPRSRNLPARCATTTFPVRARRAEDLLLDWTGSALAGKGARAIEAIERFARQMGPADGPSEVLISRRQTSPLFAAMVNAGASHLAEQDDVHNGSVFHPGAVVFPPALAVAQALGRSGRDLLTAVVAGYEVGISRRRISRPLALQVFHTTGTAGTVAAAAAAGRLLGLTATTMLDAFGSAARRPPDSGSSCATPRFETAAHREGRRRRAPGRVLAHTAFTGAAASSTARRAWPPACRPMPIRRASPTGWASAGPWRKRRSSSTPRAGTRIRRRCPAQVSSPNMSLRRARSGRSPRGLHQGRDRRAGPGDRPGDGASGQVSMGTVLAQIRPFRRAGLAEFEHHFRDSGIVAFLGRVRMVHDAEVEAAYPQRGSARSRSKRQTAARSRAASTSPRRIRQHAVAGRACGQGAAAGRIRRSRDAGGMRALLPTSSRSPPRRAWAACCPHCRRAAGPNPWRRAARPADDTETARQRMTSTDFDARAATWDDDPTKVERARGVADAIGRHVPLAPSMRALEYGCGTACSASCCGAAGRYHAGRRFGRCSPSPPARSPPRAIRPCAR